MGHSSGWTTNRGRLDIVPSLRPDGFPFWVRRRTMGTEEPSLKRSGLCVFVPSCC
jgi:hypothetical protein